MTSGYFINDVFYPCSEEVMAEYQTPYWEAVRREIDRRAAESVLCPNSDA